MKTVEDRLEARIKRILKEVETFIDEELRYALNDAGTALEESLLTPAHRARLEKLQKRVEHFAKRKALTADKVREIRANLRASRNKGGEA